MTLSHLVQGHVKVKIDTLLNFAERPGGAAVAEEFAAFVHDQIYAMKDLVEREELDCEFELRRSFDVFVDDAEAEKVKTKYRACLNEGHRWTRERQLIIGDMAEEVSQVPSHRTTVADSIGHIRERR